MGISVQPLDGVRDHAIALAQALERQGVRSSSHWLSAHTGGVARHEHVLAWTRTLPREVSEARAEALLFHYSAFSYYHLNLPLLVRPTVAALRRCGLPLLTFGHELAYPWLRGIVRGTVWATADRLALRGLVAASAAVIVTTEPRLRWLCSRPWLPARATAMAPVFSNLPVSTAEPPGDRDASVVGLFGYGVDAATIAVVLDALGDLRDRGARVRLLLLGRPGRASSAGEAWSRLAAARRLGPTLCFARALAAQELADALARCDALLYVNPVGLMSSKGTLAASLASGRPLVALAGRSGWPQLLDAGAVRIVPREARSLADALDTLLGDRRARAELGAAGQAFAAAQMGVQRTAQTVTELLAAAM